MKQIHLTIPHSWEELTDTQLTFVSSLFLQGLDRNAFLAKAFIALCGLKILPGRFGDHDNPAYRFQRAKGETFTLSLGELQDFSKECDFLLNDRNTFKPLPEIAGRKARNEMMYDASFGEFIAAMVYSNQFQDIDHDLPFLYKLCAVMYPSGEWQGEPTHPDNFQKIPLHLCYTAFLWFGTIMNIVVKECPDLFRSGTEEAEPAPLRDNIHAMYSLVTEHDITKEKEVSKIDMWRVLYDMNDKAKRIKEMNEQLEKHGRV